MHGQTDEGSQLDPAAMQRVSELMDMPETTPYAPTSADACLTIVTSLMRHRQGTECESFSHRAIESLVRKLKEKKDELDYLITAITTNGAHPTKCVTIQRSLDGRVQVAGRKGFPHVIYAKLWRWPDLHRSEMQHIKSCLYAYELKCDLICVNPYHYDRIVSPGYDLTINPEMSPGLSPSGHLVADEYSVRSCANVAAGASISSAMDMEGEIKETIKYLPSPAVQPAMQGNSQPSPQTFVPNLNQPAPQPAMQGNSQPSPQTFVPNLNQPAPQPAMQGNSQPSPQTFVPNLNQPAPQPAMQGNSQPSPQTFVPNLNQPAPQPAMQGNSQESRQPYLPNFNQPAAQPAMLGNSQQSQQPFMPNHNQHAAAERESNYNLATSSISTGPCTSASPSHPHLDEATSQQAWMTHSPQTTHTETHHSLAPQNLNYCNQQQQQQQQPLMSTCGSNSEQTLSLPQRGQSGGEGFFNTVMHSPDLNQSSAAIDDLLATLKVNNGCAAAGSVGAGVSPGSMLVSNLPLPETWCSIAYYELDTQVGETFKVDRNYPRVVVDGFVNPAGGGRFCIGALSNVHRTEKSEKTRLHIGKGIELELQGEGDVWLSCLSEHSVFAQSHYLDRVAGRTPGDVCHKIYPNAVLKVFDLRQCYKHMRSQVATAQAAAAAQAAAVAGHLAQGTPINRGITAAAGIGVDDLRRLSILRVSFIKGFGSDYPRNSIKETPCWIEIRLHRALQLLDNLLVAMPGGGPCAME